MKVRFTVYLAVPMTVDAARGAAEQVTEQVTKQVTEQVGRFLLCLKAGPLGRREAMHCLGLSHRPTFLYDYLQPAMQAGFAETTQPDSPTSPTQKYRLTTKGRAVVLQERKAE